MSDFEQDPHNEEDRFVPASPVKRAMAWIGVVYMLILVGLTTYFYFTGTMLAGLAPLLVIPGLVGLGIVALLSHRTTGNPGRGAAWGLAIVSWFLAAVSLLPGIAGLMTNF